MTEPTNEDSQLRELFAAGRSGVGEPHWAPDASALARVGDRQIARNRMLTFAGAFIAAAAVAAGTVGILGGSSGTAQPAQPASSSSGSSRHPASDVLRYWRFDMGSEYQADSPYPMPTAAPKTDPDLDRLHVTTPEAQTLLAIADRLDPGYSHLHRAAGAGPELKVGDGPQMSGRLYAKAVTWWAPESHATQFGEDSGTNILAVTLTQAPPSGRADPVIEVAPCGVNVGMLGVTIGAPGGTGQIRGGLGKWDCKTVMTMADGSVIKTASGPDAGGTATVAVREFPDHAVIGVVAIDFAVYDDRTLTPNSWQFAESGSSHAGRITIPSPWNVAELAYALMDPRVSEFK